MRTTAHCSQSTAARGRDILLGCGSGVLAPVLFAGGLAAQGIAAGISLPDTDSDSYIFANGSEEQIYQRLSENWLIGKCGLGAIRSEEFMQLECPQSATLPGPRDCTKAQEKLKQQQACKHHQDTRKAFRLEDSSLREQARERAQENSKRKAEQQKLEKALKEIDKSCGKHINPYRESLAAKILFLRVHLLQETMHAIRPNPSHVEAYNQCVAAHPKSSAEVLQELTKEPRGLIDKALSQYESFKCYSPQVQTALYCEVAASLYGGGALSKLALQKLGRKRAVRSPTSTAPAQGRIPIRSCVPDDCQLENVEVSSSTFSHVRSRHVNESVNQLPQQAHGAMAKVKEHSVEINSLNARRNAIQAELKRSDLDPDRKKELTREYQVHTMKVREILEQNLSLPHLDKKKNSTFYPLGQTPENLVSELPNSLVERVHRGDHSTLYRTRDDKGVVYDFWVCRRPPCQVDGHDTQTANELLSIYPVCGPNVLSLKSLQLIDKVIMGSGIDNVSAQDLYFSPPCP